MRYETWVRTFHPIRNHLTPNTAMDGYVFLTNGDDLEFIKRFPRNQTWTFVVSDEASRPAWLISDGMHVVNAMGYLITCKPFDASRFYEIRY